LNSYIKFILIGAVAYWLSDSIIQSIHFKHITVWISLLTFVPPASVIFVWYKLHKKSLYLSYPKAFPLFMLLGIWLFGPIAIAIYTQFNGGSFLNLDNLLTFVIMWIFFPVSTFIMSTYSGSLGGVVLITIALIVIAYASPRKRA